MLSPSVGEVDGSRFFWLLFLIKTFINPKIKLTAQKVNFSLFFGIENILKISKYQEIVLVGSICQS